MEFYAIAYVTEHRERKLDHHIFSFTVETTIDHDIKGTFPCYAKQHESILNNNSLQVVFWTVHLRRYKVMQIVFGIWLLYSYNQLECIWIYAFSRFFPGSQLQDFYVLRKMIHLNVWALVQNPFFFLIDIKQNSYVNLVLIQQKLSQTVFF